MFTWHLDGNTVVVVNEWWCGEWRHSTKWWDPWRRRFTHKLNEQNSKPPHNHSSLSSSFPHHHHRRRAPPWLGSARRVSHGLLVHTYKHKAIILIYIRIDLIIAVKKEGAVMRGSLLGRRTATRLRQVAISAVKSAKIKLLLCCCVLFAFFATRTAPFMGWTDHAASLDSFSGSRCVVFRVTI